MKQSLSDYQMCEILGAGAAGTIHRAIEKKTGNEVALKILHPHGGSDPMVAVRFQREMEILGQLSHPHIVRYYGGGENQGHLFFAMELVDGPTLRRVIETRGSLPWPQALLCTKQICSALQHAHNHGIVHRDLKPSNLFLDKSGSIKLGDFGIARDLNATDLTETGQTVGTYTYMAPELIRGERYITGKTDLYGVGCLLFELLTGRAPFPGENFAQILHQHLYERPPRLADVGLDCPAEVEALLGELLEKDPEKRPFNARAVEGRIIEILITAGYHDASRSDETTSSNHSIDRPAAEVKAWPDLANLANSPAGIGALDVSWTRIAWLLIGIAAGIGLAMFWGR